MLCNLSVHFLLGTKEGETGCCSPVDADTR